MKLIDADAMLERNKNSIYDTTDLDEIVRYEPIVLNIEKLLYELNDLHGALHVDLISKDQLIDECISIIKENIIV